MSRALVMAVYYSSSAFTISWSAPLPIRIRVDSGWSYTSKYGFQRWSVFAVCYVVI